MISSTMGSNIWTRATNQKLIFGCLIALIIFVWTYHQQPEFLNVDLPKFKKASPEHPIVTIAKASRARFEGMLMQQSRDVKSARAEYLRRYRRQPPRGFDEWFEVAQEHDFPLPDEFDGLMENLEPYFGIPADIIRSRTESAIKLGKLEIITVANRTIEWKQSLEWLMNKTIRADWMKYVPYNVTLILNTRDEPFVNAYFDEVQDALHYARANDTNSRVAWVRSLNPNAEFADHHKQNGWAITSRGCNISSVSRQSSCPGRENTDPFKFVSDWKAAQDVCENCDLQFGHGLLLSAGNLEMMRGLVPVWSASKMSHFNDILYPSPYYANERFTYDGTYDKKWDEKADKFYWTGSSTGGWSTEQSWRHLQRQRLVLKTNTFNEPVQLLDEMPAGSGHFFPRNATMKSIADLFSTRITNVVQCTDEACKQEKLVFDKPDPINKRGDSKEAAYKHKYVLDIDGNGFSGRYYRLLQSQSAVVKQTILGEWHDDRLFPWVHYVPLSTSYSELPELARFMATTEQGQKLGEQIAKDSTDWHSRTLRDVDFQIWWLRAILEYGRLYDPMG